MTVGVLGYLICWFGGLIKFLQLVLGPKTLWLAVKLHFMYMYFNTEYVYDYGDWSSYFGYWALVLSICSLCANFGVCGT